MIGQLRKSRAGRHLPDGITDGRVVHIPAYFALQPGLSGQFRGIAAEGPGKKGDIHKYTLSISCKRSQLSAMSSGEAQATLGTSLTSSVLRIKVSSELKYCTHQTNLVPVAVIRQLP